MFMEQNSKGIDAQGTQTTEFFAQQVDEAKQNLDAQDAKLAEFKKKYMGSLPDQEQTNLGRPAGMNSQLDVLTQAVNRAQQDKVMNGVAANLAARDLEGCEGWRHTHRNTRPTAHHATGPT